MPCRLSVEEFDQVRRGVFNLLAGRAYDNPLGDLFLTPQNLQYIFCEYVRRYENETGWQIDADSHRLDSFTALMYDAYMLGMCKYLPSADWTRLDNARAVQQWNEDSINSILFEALKETRKKVNYLRRARDPLYGRRTWNSVQMTKPHVAKRENAYRYAYEHIARSKRPYTMMVPDDA